MNYSNELHDRLSDEFSKSLKEKHLNRKGPPVRNSNYNSNGRCRSRIRSEQERKIIENNL
jgi:hypothetical protein